MSSTLCRLDPRRASFGSEGANLAMQGLGTALSRWSAFTRDQGFVPNLKGLLGICFMCLFLELPQRPGVDTGVCRGQSCLGSLKLMSALRT